MSTDETQLQPMPAPGHLWDAGPDTAGPLGPREVERLETDDRGDVFVWFKDGGIGGMAWHMRKRWTLVGIATPNGRVMIGEVRRHPDTAEEYTVDAVSSSRYSGGQYLSARIFRGADGGWKNAAAFAMWPLVTEPEPARIDPALAFSEKSTLVGTLSAEPARALVFSMVFSTIDDPHPRRRQCPLEVGCTILETDGDTWAKGAVIEGFKSNAVAILRVGDECRPYSSDRIASWKRAPPPGLPDGPLDWDAATGTWVRVPQPPPPPEPLDGPYDWDANSGEWVQVPVVKLKAKRFTAAQAATLSSAQRAALTPTQRESLFQDELFIIGATKLRLNGETIYDERKAGRAVAEGLLLASDPIRLPDHGALRDKSSIMESLEREIEEGIAEHVERADAARRGRVDPYAIARYLRNSVVACGGDGRLLASMTEPHRASRDSYACALPYVPQKLSRFDALAAEKAVKNLALRAAPSPIPAEGTGFASAAWWKKQRALPFAVDTSLQAHFKEVATEPEAPASAEKVEEVEEATVTLPSLEGRQLEDPDPPVACVLRTEKRTLVLGAEGVGYRVILGPNEEAMFLPWKCTNRTGLYWRFVMRRRLKA